jgi:Domain of unknown function (DUF4388)
MNNSLQGTLHEGGLVNTVQYLAMNKGTGCLTVRHAQGEQGQLYVEAGQVVHVTLGSHRDVRAMAMLLEWQEGNYMFRPETILTRTMRSSIERLLLEAVMYNDVSKQKGHNPFYEDSILTARPLQKDQVVEVSIRAVQLLPQLDGLRTLGEIARSVHVDFVEVLSAANELHQQGLTDHRAITISSDFTDSLKSLVVNIMGPMGEIVVEDALYTLGVSSQAVPQRVIPALLRDLENEMRHRRWREQFEQGARQLCQHYGISTHTQYAPDNETLQF